jgi:hypothetical protein
MNPWGKGGGRRGCSARQVSGYTSKCDGCHTSHVTRHTSHVTHHTSHVTRHTSHVTRHTSHVTHARIVPAQAIQRLIRLIRTHHSDPLPLLHPNPAAAQLRHSTVDNNARDGKTVQAANDRLPLGRSSPEYGHVTFECQCGHELVPRSCWNSRGGVHDLQTCVTTKPGAIA